MMKKPDESIMADHADVKVSGKRSFCRVVHYVVPESITTPAVYSQAIGTVMTLPRGLKMPVIYIMAWQKGMM